MHRILHSSLFAATLGCATATTAPVFAQSADPAQITVVLVGDSTVATQGGWGPAMCATFTPQVRCLDEARNGRSSKSFLDEGLWTRALADKGQYYLIQFGHNDEKMAPALHTDPTTTYEQNLRRYISDSRAIGAVPMLVTPLSRRIFQGTHLAPSTLTAYSAAVREVAVTEHVPVIDLNALSVAKLNGMTQEQADAFDAKHADAQAENSAASGHDRTHLNDLGKAYFGRMVAVALAQREPTLAKQMQIPAPVKLP